MFMHFQGSGIGHKVTWGWNKFLEHDHGSGRSRDGRAEAAGADKMTDLDGGEDVDEEEADEEVPREGEDEDEDKDEDKDEAQLEWNTVMAGMDDDESEHGVAEEVGEDSDLEKEDNEDDIYGREEYGTL